jgi:hypothetical protein
MPEPVTQIPKKQLTDKRSIPTVYPRFQKVGEAIGFQKTFVEDVWDDERIWNDSNVWGS